MRLLQLKHQQKVILTRETVDAKFIRKMVGGAFEGIPLPSPDFDLPPEDSSLFLYYNALGKMDEALVPNFQIGRGGRIVRGAAVLVGLNNTLSRDLTDLELKRIYFKKPLPGALPLLDIYGHDITAPRTLRVEE